MGLDQFKSQSSNSSTSQTKQVTLEFDEVDKFYKKWNKTITEALYDPEWIATRIKEDGWDFEILSNELGRSKRAVFEGIKNAVKEGELEYGEIPDIDEPDFRNHHASWYVRQALNHKNVPYVPSDDYIIL